MSRAFFVWLHRWTGLAMAGFLILVGLTGSLLAFWLEINQWLTPELYPAPRAGIELDAATLARRAEAIVLQARDDRLHGLSRLSLDRHGVARRRAAARFPIHPSRSDRRP
ncbi:MAG: PepSY-associated TM helix domain-containing protein [Methylocystis sp.]